MIRMAIKSISDGRSLGRSAANLTGASFSRISTGPIKCSIPLFRKLERIHQPLSHLFGITALRIPTHETLTCSPRVHFRQFQGLC